MATHEVDQKLLGRLAKHTTPWSPLVAGYLYRVLGLSMLLNQHLIRARRRRNLDNQVDESFTSLVHHIIFMAREGLSCTESYIIPLAETIEAGVELRVFAAKLRASFFHIFCLYRNSPPVKQIGPRSKASASTVKARALNPLSLAHQKSNSQLSASSNPSITPKRSKSRQLVIEANKENTAAIKPEQPSDDSSLLLNKSLPMIPVDPATQTQSQSSSPPANRRTSNIRDTISSVVSDSSFITNPYAAPRPSIHDAFSPPIPRGFNNDTGGLRDAIPSAFSEASYMTNPYLGPNPATPPPLRHLPPIASPSHFLLPPHDYIPQTLHFFSRASSLARTHLSGCAPLRLSVACEYAAFLGECMEDWKGAREVARTAVKESHKAWVEVGGEEFDDAMPFVAYLVRMAKDGTETT